MPNGRTRESHEQVRRPAWFARFAKAVAHATGHSAAFCFALLVVLAWALSGPLFHYSDTWQLAVNTGTTIVTFLMVFLIQATQNRDAVAVQLKLDELIRAVSGASNALIDLEELDDEELGRLHARYAKLAQRAVAARTNRQRRAQREHARE
jgi:low affinity Fe/Cu permease